MEISSTSLRIRALIATVAFAALSTMAVAANVKVKLVGAEETPPVTSSATGSASLKIAADKSVSGSIKTKGIAGTVAHVHVGAPGVAGPPIITLTQTSDGVWSIPEGSKLTDEQYASFKAGNLYVNVHSDAHKLGEIRGQLKP